MSDIKAKMVAEAKKREAELAKMKKDRPKPKPIKERMDWPDGIVLEETK